MYDLSSKCRFKANRKKLGTEEHQYLCAMNANSCEYVKMYTAAAQAGILYVQGNSQ